LTMAPEDRSDWPVMWNFFSCRAVSRCCWLSMRRVLISSMNSTPLWALWMAPASTRSCAGVSSPPDWNGSCLTSPRSAPAWAPVASMNGAMVLPWFDTRSLGVMTVSFGVT